MQVLTMIFLYDNLNKRLILIKHSERLLSRTVTVRKLCGHVDEG